MMKIPMLNLKREYLYMKDQIDRAIEACLDHQQWIGGPQVRELEERVARYLGVNHARGVSSGTDALVIALRAMAITREGREHFTPQDEIITTPFTFSATGEAILRAGATPVFVDVEPHSFNINPELIREYLASHPAPERVKGVVVVHLFGQPAPMDAIAEVAEDYGLFIVEDAAQAFGARWRGKRVGSLADAGCFSFFPSKNLGGFGDGGMVVTNDDRVAETMAILANHGGRDKYSVEMLGYNARLDTVQAAVLLVRLGHLEEFNNRRRRIAGAYSDGLGGLEWLSTPIEVEGAHHVYHQYTLKVDSGRRDGLRQRLTERGVATMVYYPLPLHRMGLFRERAKRATSLEVAEGLCNQVLSLPIEPLQTDEEVGYIIDSIRGFAGG